MRRKRIVYGRIAQETHAFSPEASTLESFERNHAMEGDALAEAIRWTGDEVPGWTRFAELSGFHASTRRHRSRLELLPLFSLWAVPAGPLTEDTFGALCAKLRASLEAAGEVDAVFFVLHGAMRALGDEREPEAAFLELIREVVGPDVPVVITLDLHALLTPRLVAATDAIAAYRTNPHRDLYGTGKRAGSMLMRMLFEGARPAVAWRALPMVFGGGNTIDLLRPMRGVFRALKQLERRRGVMDVSLFMCHIWNDSPQLCWAAYAVTDGDPGLADEVADAIAELAWGVRHDLPPTFLSPAEAIEQARGARLRRALGTICFTDASDVVGSGATGENTHLLRALLERGQGLQSYVPLRDAAAVRALWDAAPGLPVACSVGGRFDPEMYPPIEVAGCVRAKLQSERFGRMVALDLGHVQLVLTELAPYTLKPSFYSQLGLRVRDADVVVVKSFFHFRIYYAPIMRGAYVVQTRGLTDLDLVEAIDLDEPLHPLSEVRDWRPMDRRRRGVFT